MKRRVTGGSLDRGSGDWIDKEEERQKKLEGDEEKKEDRKGIVEEKEGEEKKIEEEEEEDYSVVVLGRFSLQRIGGKCRNTEELNNVP